MAMELGSRAAEKEGQQAGNAVEMEARSTHTQRKICILIKFIAAG